MLETSCAGAMGVLIGNAISIPAARGECADVLYGMALGAAGGAVVGAAEEEVLVHFDQTKNDAHRNGRVTIESHGI